MGTHVKGVISIGRKTLITAGVLLLLVGSYFAWHFLRPEPAPKSALFSYLRTKTGQKVWPVSEELRQSQAPWLELGKALEAANDYPTMYRHIAEHVTFADQLLTNQAQHASGLKVALEASRGALTGAEDGWLATCICEAFLLPHFKLAESSKGGGGPTLDQLIAQTVDAVQAWQDFDGQIAYYRRLINRESAQHECDWARAQCAALLGKLGQGPAALALLREIKDPGAAGKKAAKKISKLEKKLAEQQPSATAATNTTKPSPGK